jgi:hypothetical protein
LAAVLYVVQVHIVTSNAFTGSTIATGNRVSGNEPDRQTDRDRDRDRVFNEVRSFAVQISVDIGQDKLEDKLAHGSVGPLRRSELA